MSNNGNLEPKDETSEGKRAKNTPKRRKFRSFSLGKSIWNFHEIDNLFWLKSASRFSIYVKLRLYFKINFYQMVEYLIQGFLIFSDAPERSQMFFDGGDCKLKVS